jgi:nitronate monooxygenase
MNIISDRNLESRVRSLPQIIQGGMGISVSNWRLAKAVSSCGQLGVVSGTAIEAVHARILSLGDPEGKLRDAYSYFPDKELVGRVMKRYFNEGGKSADERYHTIPMFKLQPSKNLLELIVLSNFAEVKMAKGDEDLPVGVNYLQKIEVPTPAAIFGAMIAGVDVVLMGAGIPSQIPQLLNDLSEFKSVDYPVKVINSPQGMSFKTTFDPANVMDLNILKSQLGADVLKRPVFLAIVSSDVLAYFLAKSERTKPDGYVVEGPTAGGHNAPPRGKLTLDDSGQPIYGTRDEVDFNKLVELGIPFWMAGGYGNPEKLKEALELGAKGIQVGSVFSVCH